jgi:hypothetical protein
MLIHVHFYKAYHQVKRKILWHACCRQYGVCVRQLLWQPGNSRVWRKQYGGRDVNKMADARARQTSRDWTMGWLCYISELKQSAPAVESSELQRASPQSTEEWVFGPSASQSVLECEPSQVLEDRQPVKTQWGDSASVVVNCSEL